MTVIFEQPTIFDIQPSSANATIESSDSRERPAGRSVAWPRGSRGSRDPIIFRWHNVSHEFTLRLNVEVAGAVLEGKFYLAFQPESEDESFVHVNYDREREWPHLRVTTTGGHTYIGPQVSIRRELGPLELRPCE